jgi:hypothetical protein
MNDCALSELPDLSGFEQLASIDLRNNFLGGIEPRRLPPCPVDVVLRQNQVQTIGLFRQQQLDCLKEFDMALNPLQCQCTLVPLMPILQQQSMFYVGFELAKVK